MRILYCTEHDLTEETGPTAHIFGLIEGLAERGHSVHLVGPRIRSGIPIARPDLPARVTFLPVMPGKTGRFSFLPVLALWLAVRLFVSRPDLVYYRASHYTLPPPLLARLFSIPVLAEVNGFFSEDMIRAGRSSLAILLARIQETIAYRLVAGHAGIGRIVLQNETVSAEFLRRYPFARGIVEAVPVGTDCGFLCKVTREEARKILTKKGWASDSDGNVPLAAFVGTHDAWQGLEILLEALAIVKGDNVRMEAVIAGDGRIHEKLRSKAARLGIEDRVTFPGRVPRETAALILRGADCAVIPRGSDAGFFTPIKLYDILACGTCAVVSDLPGLSAVREYKAGLLVRPADPDSLADALKDVARDPAAAHALGEAGRCAAQKNLSWDAAAKRVEDILSDTV